MGSPVVAEAVAEVTHAAEQQQPNGHALRLLLQFLPFRASSKPGSQRTQQLNHYKVLEDLNQNPLRWYSSICQQQPAVHAALRSLSPGEESRILLNYVKLAAEAEEKQQQDPPTVPGFSRRTGPKAPADVAAELHALYALAAAGAATQQQQQLAQDRHTLGSKRSLSAGEFAQLLKAFAALDEQTGQGSYSIQQQIATDSKSSQHDSSSATADAAAVLYAFATLADAAAQQEQQQHGNNSHLAAGQLPSLPGSAPASVGGKEASSNNSGAAVSMGYQRGSYDSQHQDLQVLLQLAQLGVQA